MEGELNDQELLGPHPAATYFLKASGESMIGAGIHNGDLLVVDRSREPVSGKVVIAVIEGELTIKRLVKRKNKTFLVPENPAFAEIDITGMEDASIWGVVTHVVHNL